jgi:hypothetical protein
MWVVGILAVVLAVCALLLVLGAEWPRISARLGGRGIRMSSPRRRRRKQRLRVVEPVEDDDFAASVQRDLENLPVLEERDGKSRR